jgi:ubiquinone/menaquinone biosynthesis C-methylase UbiE
MAMEATTTERGEEVAAPDQVMMQMLAAAWVTKALAAAARLGIADALASGPKTVDELARTVQAHPGATKRLMRALAGLGVFAPKEGGRYGLTEMGELLREDHPRTLKHMFIGETDTVHLRSWEKMLDAVRTGLPRPEPVFGVPAFEYYSQHKDEGEQFGRAMENISRFVAKAVLEAYDFGGIRTLADIGGGNGSMALAVLARYPQLRGIVYDLPYIEAQANDRIHQAGVEDRCRFEPGDFFERAPKGADAHLLKFILHDWNDEDSVRLLKRCRETIDPKGLLLVLEVLVPAENRPDFSHLMDLNMLVMTGGMERTEAEYASLFERGGFRLHRVVPTASPFSLIEAKPA